MTLCDRCNKRAATVRISPDLDIRGVLVCEECADIAKAEILRWVPVQRNACKAWKDALKEGG